LKTIYILSVVTHACDPSTKEDEAGGFEFKGSLGYIVRFCLKTTTITTTTNRKQEREKEGGRGEGGKKEERKEGRKEEEGKWYTMYYSEELLWRESTYI
jgi:hypothetical protein